MSVAMPKICTVRIPAGDHDDRSSRLFERANHGSFVTQFADGIQVKSHRNCHFFADHDDRLVFRAASDDDSTFAGSPLISPK